MDRALLAQQLASINEHAGHLFTWEMPDTGATGLAHGTLSDLRPDDPRVQGRTERMMSLVIATYQLDPRPRSAMELKKDGRYYVINRLDDNENTGMTTLLVAAPTQAVEL